MSWPHPYACQYSPELERIPIYGVFEGQKFADDFDRHANLKYKYGNRHFLCRGYYVDTVGRNKKAIEEYIRHQLDEDFAYEQMTFKEFVDPFTGSKNNKT